MQCISKPLSNGVEQLGLNLSRFVNRNVACYLYPTRFLSRLDHSPKTIKIIFLILKRQFLNYLWSLNFLFISLKRSSNEWAVAVWQVAIIFNLMCYSNTTASYQKPPLSTSIYIYLDRCLFLFLFFLILERKEEEEPSTDSENYL